MNERREAGARAADVFFYGLFMDPDLLRAKGLNPERVEQASVQGFSLRIGQRAALVRTSGARVHGVVMSLTLPELDALYSEPGLQAYRAEAVLAKLSQGGTIAALCYNLPESPSATERNTEYCARLKAVAERMGLPPDYIDSIR
jgi:hypothetical protein